MKRALRAALLLIVIDLFLVVIGGGVSILGTVSGPGFALRLGLALALLAADYGFTRQKAALHAYVGLLLALLPLLHYRGYRLRGDGLWYYSFTHSVAFDGDIDLTNEYRRLGIDPLSGSQPVRDTGRARYTFPVGAPLVWVPFVWVGHIGVALRNAHGLETAYDGFSDPYFHAVALGNLLIGWAGLLVLDRLLRKWFAPATSFLAVFGIALGSFLTWYLTYHAIYTHALAFTLSTLVVKRWVDGPESARDYAVLGALIGASTCVRWQSGVFALLPAWSLLGRLSRGEVRFALISGAAFSGAFLPALLPQLLSWKIIFGSFFIGVPLGAGYMRWSDPFWTEVLFSSRHGLFSWSPLLLFAVFGLVAFAIRAPRIALPLLALLALVTAINGAVADWWGGGSYGARRFDAALPILALGLSEALSRLTEWIRRRPVWVTGAVVGAFVVSNALLMEQYRKERLPADDTISWEVAAGGMLEDAFDAVGYPFSFPMNWLFASSYDRPKTQYDILVGKYLFHRMHGLGGIVELGEHDSPFIGNGWTSVTDWEERPRGVRLAVGPRAGVFIPIDRRESLRVFIECALPKGVEPTPIEVRLNAVRLGGFVAGADMAEHALTADAPLWKRINLLELVPYDHEAGRPYLAVDRLRFERTSER